MNLDIKSPAFIQIFGSCGSGKTHLLKYLVSHMAKSGQFDHCILFSNTAGWANGDYDYIPEEYQFSMYDDDVLLEYMKIQKQAISSGSKSKGLVIFDDVLGQANLVNNRVLLQLCTQFRHYSCSIILVSQWITKIGPTLRELATNVFLFSQTTKLAYENSFDSFGGHFNNLAEWKGFLKKCTGDYKFLLVNNKSKTNNIEDVYKSMKCPAKIKDFVLEF